MKDVRTWIEIDKSALHANVKQFLKLIPRDTRFMAVVKSNAYGHGLSLVAKQIASYKLPIIKLWFGVDSIVEGLRLREDGISHPILVLGATLPARLSDAEKSQIAVSVSTFEILDVLGRMKSRPVFHLKIDTGMHRQGFLVSDVPKLIRALKKNKLVPEGVFTHFSSAKDVLYPTYTQNQISEFKKTVSLLDKAGFQNLIQHAGASGGTLLFPEAHFDMVRIGMGIYGYFPSLETRMTAPLKKEIASVSLLPVLSWKTRITEIKEIPNGSYIGYDLTECVHRKSRIAILPIGYWHGYDRGLSGVGEVLICGSRARVLGRVSMDMIIVDVTDISVARVMDEVVLIGAQGKEYIGADELGLKIGTSQYEFLTRINPLIQRDVV